jgi:hypothetical protein
MQADGWIRLLRRIPAEQLDKLSLTTTNGTELSIQNLVRLDEEFMLVRARITGSSDAGRAFFIPYDQINFLGFQKPVKEEALRALFDGSEPMPLPARAPSAELDPVTFEETADAEALPFAEDAAAPPEEAPAVELAPPPEVRALPTKSRVLANLRARLKSGGAK